MRRPRGSDRSRHRGRTRPSGSRQGQRCHQHPTHCSRQSRRRTASSRRAQRGLRCPAAGEAPGRAPHRDAAVRSARSSIMSASRAVSRSSTVKEWAHSVALNTHDSSVTGLTKWNSVWSPVRISFVGSEATGSKAANVPTSATRRARIYFGWARSTDVRRWCSVRRRWRHNNSQQLTTRPFRRAARGTGNTCKLQSYSAAGPRPRGVRRRGGREDVCAIACPL